MIEETFLNLLEGDRTQLPENWRWSRLVDVCDVFMGQSPPSSTYNEEGLGLPFFQGKADFGEVYPSIRKWCAQPQRIAQSGDILMSVRAPVGPTNIANTDCCIGRGLSAIRPGNEISLWFLFRYLQHIGSQIADLGQGSTFTAISRKEVENLYVPVPPLDEQRRIVAKLESILAQIRTARAALHRIPPTLKALRQSVLAAAFRGELVDYEQIDRTPLLPLSQVIERIKTGPFGSTLHKSDYVTNGCPVINPMHIINGRIVPSPNMAISQKKAADLSEFRLAEGDIIIGRRGEMGRCAVVSKIEHGWICGTGSMALRPKSFILPGYLQLFLSSPDTITALEENSVGTTMLNLNQKILLNLAVRVPDIEVQEIVIQRINSAISFAGIIESVAKNASDKLDRIEQSALAKAFRGELL